MHRITETDLELLAIEKLEALGYQYVYGPSIAVDGEKSERNSYLQVILPDRLRKAIQNINPNAPAVAVEQAFNTIARAATPDLLLTNETFTTSSPMEWR